VLRHEMSGMWSRVQLLVAGVREPDRELGFRSAKPPTPDSAVAVQKW
jgi:hypothetical protein